MNGWGEIAALAPCILGPGCWVVGGMGGGGMFCRFSALWLSRHRGGNPVGRTFREEGKSAFKVEICKVFFGLMAEIGILGKWSYYDNPLSRPLIL